MKFVPQRNMPKIIRFLAIYWTEGIQLMEQLLADLRHGPDFYEIKDINKENGSSSGSLCNFQCFTDP